MKKKLLSLIGIGLLVPLSGFGQYCTIGVGPIETDDSNVESININGDSQNISYTGCTTGGVLGVEDQTSQSADLTPGNSYTLTVAFGTCSVDFYDGSGEAWIDFNADGTFDAIESIGTWTGTPPTTENFAFTVPAGAVLGTTRMRVTQEEDGGLPLDPCGSFDWGSVTDFNIDIAVGVTCFSISDLNQVSLTNDTLVFDFTNGGTATSFNVEWGTSGYTPGTGTEAGAYTTTALQDSVIGFTPGVAYDLYVQSDCGGGDLGNWSGPITFYIVGDLGYLVWDSTCTTPFEDISLTGDGIYLDDGDHAGRTLPFYFQLDDQFSNEITIGDDGGIEFGTLSGYVNYATPISNQNNGMYPFATDFDNSGSDYVYYEVRGTAPNRRAIIQWHNRPHYSTGENATFQLILYEGTNEIKFVYEDVLVGDIGYDRGNDTGIGVMTNSGDVEVSYEEPILHSGMCILFNYVTCPPIDNVNITYVGLDSVIFDFTPFGTETSWDIEYGPAGFTPGTGTSFTTTTTTDTIPGLSQNTEYDFYIVSDCGGGDMSPAYGPVNFLTDPICPNPMGLNATLINADSIVLAWTNGGAESMWNVEWGTSGFMQGSGTVVAFDTNPDTLTGIPAGVVLDIYIQADCGGGTNNPWFGPIQVATPIANDSTCDAINLMLDSNYIYSNIGATTQIGETRGTGTSTAFNTVWFTFTAPASGAVEFDLTNSDFDTYSTIYEVVDCDDFSTYTAILGAAPEQFEACSLTPGNEYYLQVGGFSNNVVGIIDIILTELVIDAGTFVAADVCAGSSLDLNTTISGQTMGGTWTETSPNLGAVSGNIYNASAFQAAGTYEVEYSVSNACSTESILVDVNVSGTANAGTDGTISQECNFGTVSLFDGLTGSVDLGGTWYDATMTAIVGTTVDFNGEAAGSYVYSYVVPSVCGNDTATTTIDLIDCTSIGENEGNGAFSIYPNPSTGTVFLKNEGNEDKIIIEVSDINGKMMTIQNISLNKGEVYNLDLNTNVKGIYFIRIKTNSGIGQHKVIVQ